MSATAITDQYWHREVCQGLYLDAGQLSLADALRSSAGNDTGLIKKLDYDDLGRRSGLKPRTVGAKIAGLEALGLIITTKKAAPGRTAEYKLSVPKQAPTIRPCAGEIQPALTALAAALGRGLVTRARRGSTSANSANVGASSAKFASDEEVTSAKFAGVEGSRRQSLQPTSANFADQLPTTPTSTSPTPSPADAGPATPVVATKPSITAYWQLLSARLDAMLEEPQYRDAPLTAYTLISREAESREGVLRQLSSEPIGFVQDKLLAHAAEYLLGEESLVDVDKNSWRALGRTRKLWGADGFPALLAALAETAVSKFSEDPLRYAIKVARTSKEAS